MLTLQYFGNLMQRTDSLEKTLMLGKIEGRRRRGRQRMRLVLYFLYSFVAALLQPLGDSRMLSLLEQTAGSFMLVFAIVALTGVLFFFMILIVLAAGGSTF